MYYIFTIISCLILSPIFGESIGNVEYHLPKAASDWEIGAKMDNEVGSTTIYIPKGTVQGSPTEFFGVGFSKQTFDPKDPASIEEGFKKQFKDMQVDFKVLDKDANSVTFEWVVKDKGKELIHAWTRAFAQKNGTVILEYVAEKVDDMSKSKGTWLQVLKDAKSGEESQDKQDKK